jgi:hypothetical protein
MGSAAVNTYRAYRLNGAGRIVAGSWIEAADDLEAKRLAHDLCDEATPTVELWLANRRVAILPCEEDVAAA